MAFSHTSTEFRSEVVAALDRGDELVRRCASGQLAFAAFLSNYDNLYWSHALDGHESTAAQAAVLGELVLRIEPHRAIAERILSRVCSESDASTALYQEAGRIGPAQAVSLLRQVAAGLPRAEA